MATYSVQRSPEFQAIAARQLGQSSTQPDYYFRWGPFDGQFFIGLALADGTCGALFDASGWPVRFSCKEDARRFCSLRNQAEKLRVRCSGVNGKL